MWYQMGVRMNKKKKITLAKYKNWREEFHENAQLRED